MNFRRYAGVSIACFLLAWSFGCNAKKNEAPPAANPVASRGLQAKAVNPAMTAAKVNGSVITEGEVDRNLDMMLSQYGAQASPEQMAAIKPLMRKQVLESLINQRLLLQEAEREGMKPDKAAIDSKLKEITAQFPSPEAFNKMLASQGVTEKQVRENLGHDLEIEALIDKKVPGLKNATEEEIKEYYKNNQKEFTMPERVRASHILIAVKPEDSEAVKAQKRAKIVALKEQIAKGADFAKLAEENSACPSKSKGGDLGYFQKGQMAPPFEAAAFALKNGEVSDVVETQFGYHLIKRTGYEKAQALTLEKARDKIIAFLNSGKKQKAVGDYLQKLRASAKIEYAQNN